MTTVLVTGVGAVTGYGVVRSLRRDDPDLRVVGADIHPDAVGAHWCDELVVAPLSADDGYPDWLARTTEQHRVDLVLPTLDADLDRFALTPGLRSSLDCAVALNSPRAIRLSRDKWELDRALAAANDPARIPSSLDRDYENLAAQLGVPFLVKPRHGRGGLGQRRVAGPDDFAQQADRIPDEAFAQQIVGTDDEEYTVGLFGDGHGAMAAVIAMRRRLAPDGPTRRAEVVPVTGTLRETLERLVGLVTPAGPTNLQLRRVGDRWFLLEVNARFSSSTSLRALFGYNEAAMTVRWCLDGVLPTQPDVRGGVAARYLEDVVLDAGAGL